MSNSKKIVYVVEKKEHTISNFTRNTNEYYQKQEERRRNNILSRTGRAMVSSVVEGIKNIFNK